MKINEGFDSTVDTSLVRSLLSMRNTEAVRNPNTASDDDLAHTGGSSQRNYSYVVEPYNFHHREDQFPYQSLQPLHNRAYQMSYEIQERGPFMRSHFNQSSEVGSNHHDNHDHLTALGSSNGGYSTSENARLANAASHYDFYTGRDPSASMIQSAASSGSVSNSANSLYHHSSHLSIPDSTTSLVTSRLHDVSPDLSSARTTDPVRPMISQIDDNEDDDDDFSDDEDSDTFAHEYDDDSMMNSHYINTSLANIPSVNDMLSRSVRCLDSRVNSFTPSHANSTNSHSGNSPAIVLTDMKSNEEGKSDLLNYHDLSSRISRNVSVGSRVSEGSSSSSHIGGSYLIPHTESMNLFYNSRSNHFLNNSYDRRWLGHANHADNIEYNIIGSNNALRRSIHESLDNNVESSDEDGESGVGVSVEDEEESEEESEDSVDDANDDHNDLNDDGDSVSGSHDNDSPPHDNDVRSTFSESDAIDLYNFLSR